MRLELSLSLNRAKPWERPGVVAAVTIGAAQDKRGAQIQLGMGRKRRPWIGVVLSVDAPFTETRRHQWKTLSLTASREITRDSYLNDNYDRASGFAMQNFTTPSRTLY